MKLTVKTLKGAKFVIDVDDSHTVEQVKAAIVRFFVRRLLLPSLRLWLD
jgi:hypothetical protein